MKETVNIPILMLPPLRLYPIAPDDQPGCEPIPCPHCKENCWISHKKRVIRDVVKPKHLWIGCYDCLTEKSKKDPLFFSNAVRIDM